MGLVGQIIECPNCHELNSFESGTINYNGSVFHISSGGAWLYEPFTITNKYNSYTYTNLNVQNNNCNVCLVDAATSLLNEYYK